MAHADLDIFWSRMVCKDSQFAKATDENAAPMRMRQPSKQHPPPEPGDRRDAPDESLHRLRSRFTRRLESFGLGEGQLPLLTDTVDSVDADGNAR